MFEEFYEMYEPEELSLIHIFFVHTLTSLLF